MSFFSALQSSKLSAAHLLCPHVLPAYCQPAASYDSRQLRQPLLLEQGGRRDEVLERPVGH